MKRLVQCSVTRVTAEVPNAYSVVIGWLDERDAQECAPLEHRVPPLGEWQGGWRIVRVFAAHPAKFLSVCPWFGPESWRSRKEGT